MAEEEEANETEETEGTEEGAEGSGKGGLKKKILIGGGVLLVIVLIGAPVLYFAFSGEDSDEAKKLGPDSAQEKEIVLMMEGFDEEDEAEEEEVPVGAYYPFETFVVNLSKGGYLRLQAHAEFESRDIPKRFFSKLIPIRDGLINNLSNKTREDLGNEAGRGKLKLEMKAIVDEVVRKEVVKKVYFTQFVIQ